MVTIKQIIVVKSGAIAMLFWEICTFEKVKESISKTTLVVVLNVDY